MFSKKEKAVSVYFESDETIELPNQSLLKESLLPP
jgi:hypothetical protein